MTSMCVCVYASTRQEGGWNGNFQCHVSKNRTCIKPVSCIENNVKCWISGLNNWGSAYLPIWECFVLCCLCADKNIQGARSVLWLVRLLWTRRTLSLSKGRNDENVQHVLSPDPPRRLCRALMFVWQPGPWETTLCPVCVHWHSEML